MNKASDLHPRLRCFSLEVPEPLQRPGEPTIAFGESIIGRMPAAVKVL